MDIGLSRVGSGRYKSASSPHFRLQYAFGGKTDVSQLEDRYGDQCLWHVNGEIVGRIKNSARFRSGRTHHAAMNTGKYIHFKQTACPLRVYCRILKPQRDSNVVIRYIVCTQLLFV